MSKRRRDAGGRFISEALTGGTGDVKPNVATWRVSGTVVDDAVTVEIQLPIGRIGTRRDRAQVFELLKIFWFLGIDDVELETDDLEFATLSLIQLAVDGTAGSAAQLEAAVRNPATLAAVWRMQGLTTSGTSFPF